MTLVRSACPLLIALLLIGCATTYHFNRGAEVPAADGSARVFVGANGNTRIAIAVQHLAPPDRVGAGANSYVAWSEVGAGDTLQRQNLGALHIDKDLSGKLQTVSAMTDFTLFITPEPAPTTPTPTGKEVLFVHISRND